MSNRYLHQTGFGTVGIVAVVLVVGVLASVGYVVLKKSSSDTSIATVTPGNSATPTLAATQPNSQPEDGNKSTIYKVSELGIQFAVADSLNDLTYHIETAKLPKNQTGAVAYFSRK